MSFEIISNTDKVKEALSKKEKPNHLRLDHTHVRRGRKHFLVSSAVAMIGDMIDETMIFRANKQGNVIEWSELLCIRPHNHKAGIDAVKNYELYGDKKPSPTKKKEVKI